MEICSTNLKEVKLIKPDIFTDFRGDNVMVWHKARYSFEGIPEFMEHNLFSGIKGVLSGIHYSPDCWKLYECVYGKVYYIFVNADETSPDFGKWQSFILSDSNHYQLIKSPCYATALLILSDYAVVYVMQSEYYNSENPNQKTFRYDDPRFKLWFPKIVSSFILSKRDERGDYLNEPRAN